MDYIVLQLQAVAYLAKRAPVLGKLVTASDADAFDTEIELVADSVIAVNDTATGFEAVPRSEFVGEVGATGATGPAGAAGADGADGADGLGILRAGNESLGSAASSVTVVFSSPTADTTYVPTPVSFVNLTDPDPIFLQGMITGKTVNGFTVTFNTPTDTANYIMAWSVQDAI
jgi:hypothetical protein